MSLVLAALDVGCGRVAISPAPGVTGAYGDDLAAVLRWAPDLVLSMTTVRELSDLGAGGFPGDLAAGGVRFRRLPVADFGAPGEDVRKKWPQVSAAAASVLNQGGRVLAHCRGGCGRSGMVVLRLMVEMGEAPDAALARLRAVRPCAVETPAQMAWAFQGAA